MILSLVTSLLRQSYLHRGIALFFVLFIFVDITCPETCAEEFTKGIAAFEISFSDQSTNQTQANNDTLDVDKHSSNSQQTQKDRDGDCCFCCCSHWIMSSSQVVLPNPYTTKPVYEYVTISLPDSPHSKIFHPPCLS